MEFIVAHRIKGRMRCRLNPVLLQRYQYYQIAQYFSDIAGVKQVKIAPRTGSLLVNYDATIINEQQLLSYIQNKPISEFSLKNKKEKEEPSIGWSVIWYFIGRLLIPAPLRPVVITAKAFMLMYNYFTSSSRFKMNVELLDAVAVNVLVLQRDYSSASTLLMLLKMGDYLEQWAKYRSKESLVASMSLNIGHVWVKQGDEEVQIPYSLLNVGDKVVIRSGSIIPVDGLVVNGEAMVNESSLTGEPLSIRRTVTDSVHAGTVIEEGELIVEVRQKGEDTRFQKIAQLIQESEATKADVETKANKFADSVVPFNFFVAGMTYAMTGNTKKATSALSVDYSCAIKLSTPLTFLAAMREGINNGVFFKGGAPIEKLSKVDTIVFDKTGTLTKASPKVIRVIPYNGYSEDEVIKIAACLEEHFPHPVARSVVNYAVEKKIEHREEHNDVKYIVAHGIATEYQNKHTIIGSRHFISEDEGIDISIAAKDASIASDKGYSVLYLAKDQQLIGLILINDPVREEAKEVILMLRSLGIKYFYMITGDNKRTAQRVAKELDIDCFRGEVLPDGKAELVKILRSKGCNVAVVGDGINDSPAMSVANIGIAMKDGADIAQEVADITLKDSSLYPLVVARILSLRAMKRVQLNNISAIGVNSVLMLLSILGIMPQASSVWLHNLTTLGVSLNSMSNLLPPLNRDETHDS